MQSEHLLPYLEELPVVLVINMEEITITCSFIPEDEGVWSLDNRHVNIAERHQVSLVDGKPQIKIVENTKENTGIYKWYVQFRTR